MRKLKLISSLLVLTMVLSLALGNVLAEGNDKTINLQFWNGLTGPDGPVMQSYVDQFNESNGEGITIEMDIIPWDNFLQKLPQSIATQTAPDFVVLVDVMLGLYSSNGSYQPMDDYFELGSVPKDQFSESSLQLFNVNGVQWQLPQALYGPAYLYYNKDQYKAAGLDPESPPKTYDELLANAKALTNPANGAYGLGIPVHDNRLIHQMMLSEGYPYFDEETKTGNMSKPEIQALLQKLQDVIAADKISPPFVNGAEMDTMAMSGQAAQYLNGPWLLDGWRNSGINFALAGIPAGSKGKACTIEGAGFAILKDTPEENKRAIYKFLDFYYSKEKGVEWALKNGNPPFLKDVIADSQIQSDPYLSVFVDSMQYAKPYYTGNVAYPEIRDDVLDPLFEKILYGGADVATETAAADKAIAEILNRQ